MQHHSITSSTGYSGQELTQPGGGNVQIAHLVQQKVLSYNYSDTLKWHIDLHLAFMYHTQCLSCRSYVGTADILDKLDSSLLIRTQIANCLKVVLFGNICTELSK